MAIVRILLLRWLVQVPGSVSRVLLSFFFLLILTCNINCFLVTSVACWALGMCLCILWAKREFPATYILPQAFSVPNCELSQAHVSPGQTHFHGPPHRKSILACARRSCWHVALLGLHLCCWVLHGETHLLKSQ